MRLKTITLMATLLCSAASFAQNPHTHEPGNRAQNIYFEGFGPGITYSFNYDTRFQNTRNGLGGRIGAGYIQVDNFSLFTVPIGINYLLGKDGKYFEMGAGATFLSGKEKNDGEGSDGILFYDGTGSTVLGNLTFGYRRQPVDGGFTFRAGFTPTFGSGFFVPWYPFISLGYAF